MISEHPFLKRPHRTLIGLSVPVFFSLVAEPLTGIVDTFFVKELGSAEMAALGIGTVALSSLFWMFSFLAISTQTEVSQAFGRGKREQAREIVSLGLTLALIFGALITLFMISFAEPIARALAAEGRVLEAAVEYVRIRAWGSPAILLSITAFGALRGLQDMRTPSAIAVGVNVANMVLDAMLVTGWGMFPALGISGVALASTASQWVGAAVALGAINRRIGFSPNFSWGDARDLLVVGGDLFMRTGLLTLFIMIATREATAISEDAGAANQAVRQIFMFMALSLDAFALTVQSLVGYFYGAGDKPQARRVVKIGLGWAFGFGLVLAGVMWLGRDLAISLLVPTTAISLFIPTWLVVALSLPTNSVSYITDGAHWGTGDYGFLRNAMFVATIIGIALLFVPIDGNWSVAMLWIAGAVWTTIRGLLGILRIWPGIGQSRLQ